MSGLKGIVILEEKKREYTNYRPWGTNTEMQKKRSAFNLLISAGISKEHAMQESDPSVYKIRIVWIDLISR